MCVQSDNPMSRIRISPSEDEDETEQIKSSNTGTKQLDMRINADFSSSRMQNPTEKDHYGDCGFTFNSPEDVDDE